MCSSTSFRSELNETKNNSVHVVSVKTLKVSALFLSVKFIRETRAFCAYCCSDGFDSVQPCFVKIIKRRQRAALCGVSVIDKTLLCLVGDVVSLCDAFCFVFMYCFYTRRMYLRINLLLSLPPCGERKPELAG